MGTGQTKLHDVTVVRNLVNGFYALVVNIDESQCSFSKVYTANQTNLDIITPASGQIVAVHGVFCATDSAAGEVALDLATSSKPVFRMYASKTQASAQSTMNIAGAADEPLTLNTTTGDNNTFLVVNYMCTE